MSGKGTDELRVLAGEVLLSAGLALQALAAAKRAGNLQEAQPTIDQAVEQLNAIVVHAARGVCVAAKDTVNEAEAPPAMRETEEA
jgi:hypothetical protein